MNTDNTDTQERAAAQSAPDADAGDAWEEIEPGRFMPRRVRGSFRGHALG